MVNPFSGEICTYNIELSKQILQWKFSPSKPKKFPFLFEIL